MKKNKKSCRFQLYLNSPKPWILFIHSLALNHSRLCRLLMRKNKTISIVRTQNNYTKMTIKHKKQWTPDQTQRQNIKRIKMKWCNFLKLASSEYHQCKTIKKTANEKRSTRSETTSTKKASTGSQTHTIQKVKYWTSLMWKVSSLKSTETEFISDNLKMTRKMELESFFTTMERFMRESLLMI